VDDTSPAFYFSEVLARFVRSSATTSLATSLEAKKSRIAWQEQLNETPSRSSSRLEKFLSLCDAARVPG
jgi:hypothetical protein